MSRNIFKNFKFRVGLDVDDVLFPCMELAAKMANEEYHLEPPITLDEITSWELATERLSIIKEYFKRADFFEAQTPLEGAQDFVRQLSKRAEVFFTTAIPPEYMGLRSAQLQRFFPWVPAENYIPVYRKDVVDMDFTLDDGSHNILASNAKYPVLFRRPWNSEMSGLLAVNSYNEFINLMDSIKRTYLDTQMIFSNPTVVALVGPSGSGKTEIAKALLSHEEFGKPTSATTRPFRNGDEPDAYHYVSKEEFQKMKAEHLFAETTVYAGNGYGVELSGINEILASGKHCVVPIDISGAMALKMQYRTVIIYIKRNRMKLIDAMLQRLMDGAATKADITRRILSLDDEKKNEMICDYTVDNNRTIEAAVEDLMTILCVK